MFIISWYLGYNRNLGKVCGINERVDEKFFFLVEVEVRDFF